MIKMFAKIEVNILWCKVLGALTGISLGLSILIPKLLLVVLASVLCFVLFVEIPYHCRIYLINNNFDWYEENIKLKS